MNKEKLCFRHFKTIQPATVIEITEGDGTEEYPYVCMLYVISKEGKLIGIITPSQQGELRDLDEYSEIF